MRVEYYGAGWLGKNNRSWPNEQLIFCEDEEGAQEDDLSRVVSPVSSWPCSSYNFCQIEASFILDRRQRR